MANVLHRTTKQYLTSVNTPDFPAGNWIIQPDLSAVTGFDSKYWIVTGDVVTLMDAPARTALDTAAVEAARDALSARLDEAEDVLRGFMLVVMDEFNGHAIKVNALMSAIDASTTYANLKTNVAAVADYPMRTATQLKNSVRGKLGT